MALDRFVYWKSERPTFNDVHECIEDYVRGLGTVSRFQDRLFVTLPGTVSFPFARVGPATEYQRASAREDRNERWFEVYIGEDSVDVITRQMDEITNNVARGFAELMARGWDGDFKE